MNEYDDLLATESNANEYDAQIALDQDQGRQRLRASMFAAQRQNPDQYGEAKRLERTTGIPAPVAVRNLPEVQQKARLNEYDQLLETSPKLAEQLQNPDFASMAHDDTGNLSMVEKIANGFRRGVLGLKQSGSATALRANAVDLQNINSIEQRLAAGARPEDIPDGEDVFGVRWMSPEQRAQFKSNFTGLITRQATNIAGLEGEKRAIPQDPVIAQALQADSFNAFWSAFKQKPVEFVATVGAESLPNSAPGMLAAIPAGVAAGPAGVAAAMGAGSFATDYASSIMEALQAEGIDTASADAIRTAVQDKALMDRVGRRAFAHAFVVSAFDAASGGIAGESLVPARLAARPAVREAANVVAQAPVQGALGTAGEAGGEIAAGQDLQPGNIMAEFFGEFATAPIEVAAASGKQIAERVHAAQSAQRDAQTLQQLGELAKQSKLLQRDPESFRQFVDAAAADGPVQDIYVDARTFAQSLQQAGIDPVQIAQASPAVAAQLDEALAAGGDIRIPVGEFAAQIAATDAGAALLPHLRTSPEAMSMDEAQTFMQSQAEEFKAEAEKMLAEHEFKSQMEESAANVERELAAQLKQANRFTDDVNGAYAKLMSAFYTVQAARLGVTPEEMYVRYPVQIRAESPLSGAVRMEQGGTSTRTDTAGAKGEGDTARFSTARGKVYQGSGPTIDIDGTKRPTTNSQGKPISYTTAALRDFWRWFGESGVVDDQGRPLVNEGLYTNAEGKHKSIDNIGTWNPNDPRILYQSAPEAVQKALPVRAADTLDEAREEAQAFIGKPLTNVETGLQAVVTRNSMRKMTSASATLKSSSAADHALAIANVDKLFTHALLDDTHPDKRGAPTIAAIHRYVAPMVTPDGTVLAVKMTVKETTGPNEPNPIYSIETIDVEKPALEAPAGTGIERGMGVEDVATTATGGLSHRVTQAVQEVKNALGDTLLQRNAVGSRGSITFGDDIRQTPSVITLGQNADLSTFLHESGHFYLEVLNDIAQQPDAPAEVVEDMNRVLQWFGVVGGEPALKPGYTRVYHSGSKGEGDFGRWVSTDRRYASDYRRDLPLHYLDIPAEDPRVNNRDYPEQSATKGFTFNFELTPAEAAQLAEISRDARTPLEVWNAMSLEEKRPYHEQFARGFEAYLFEGKAPSQELSGLFARFRAWMINVYRQLTALNVSLTDEVRGVFDRLLATNEEILAAEAARSYAPLFANAEAAGMTADEWQQYQALGHEATQAAVDQLQTRSLRDMQWLSNAKSRTLKKLQREAASKRRAVEAEVRAEVEAEPINQARRFIARGEMTTPDGEQVKVDKGHRINTDALKEMYPETMLARPDLSGLRGMTSPEGLHPDLLAEMFGFTSGDHLVRELLSAEDPKVKIEGMTDQRMLERYGDLSSPDAIDRAANEAIHNEARAKFVATELRALSKATGQRQVLVKAAKEFAAATIARKKIRDIRPAQYNAAEGRAAKAAEKATIGGDLVAAAAEKRNQLVNHYAARAAYDALDEVDKGLRYLKRVGDSESIDPDYREQINALLERFDLRQVSNKEAARRQSLVEWVESQREQNLEPVIDPALLNEAQRTPYRELPLEQFRGLVDSIKNIEHLGRLKKKLLTAKDDRDFAERVAEAAASIEDNAKRTIPAKLETNTWLDKMKSGTAEFFAMHRKFASMIREMDGYDDNGVLWNLLGRPMNEAGDREAVLREQATMKLSDLFAPILKAGKMREKMFIPEINASLSREGRIMVALNTGNAGNLQRLMDGDGWSPAQVRAIIDTLTKEEWDFVQGVWDYIDTYRADIGAQQKRLTGVEPEWVEPTPVETKFGTYRGGYIPAKYDTNRSTRSLADEASANIMDMWRAARGRPKTRDSFTKGRADAVVGRPLRKDFGVITQHVTEITHRLAWQEFLTDANRLMRAAPIDNAIRTHYGPEVLKAMRDTIQDIAAGEVGAQNAFESAINYLRSGATVAGLGWRLTTALLQPIGLTQSMVRIGPKYVVKGLAEWLGDAVKMENTVARIGEKSDMMRLRAKTMQREINEIRNKVAGKDSAIEASYFYLIQKLQLVADVPTWLGQYHKAIEQGADEPTAVAQADQAVLDAQGGGQIKDLAAIQRGGPMLKLFTNFYSFFSTTYNLTSEAVGRTRFKDPVAVGRLAVDMLLLYSVPAALGTLVKAALHGDDDWDKLMRQLISDQLTYLFGTMVGLREFAGGVQTMLGLPGDYQGPASVRIFAEIAKLGKQVSQGEVDAALLKAANNTAGILFHYPAGQINATADGLVALAEGRTQNPGALLVGGPPKH